MPIRDWITREFHFVFLYVITQGISWPDVLGNSVEGRLKLGTLVEAVVSVGRLMVNTPVEMVDRVRIYRSINLLFQVTHLELTSHPLIFM